MKKWKVTETRILTGRKKWPFHVFTRVSDPASRDALHAHLYLEHGALWWPDQPWESMVAGHCARHDSEGWDLHSHADLPDTPWP